MYQKILVGTTVFAKLWLWLGPYVPLQTCVNSFSHHLLQPRFCNTEKVKMVIRNQIGSWRHFFIFPAVFGSNLLVECLAFSAETMVVLPVYVHQDSKGVYPLSVPMDHRRTPGDLWCHHRFIFPRTARCHVVKRKNKQIWKTPSLCSSQSATLAWLA